MSDSFKGSIDPPTMTPRRRRPAWRDGREKAGTRE
jgi:hypothetical protein